MYLCLVSMCWVWVGTQQPANDRKESGLLDLRQPISRLRRSPWRSAELHQKPALEE